MDTDNQATCSWLTKKEYKERGTSKELERMNNRINGKWNWEFVRLLLQVNAASNMLDYADLKTLLHSVYSSLFSVLRLQKTFLSLNFISTFPLFYFRRNHVLTFAGISLFSNILVLTLISAAPSSWCVPGSFVSLLLVQIQFYRPIALRGYRRDTKMDIRYRSFYFVVYVAFKCLNFLSTLFRYTFRALKRYFHKKIKSA